MNSREAIVLPGAAYGPSAPLLMYPSSAAQARGATIRPVHWNDPARMSTLQPDERGPWVEPQVPTPTEGADTVLIGKSLGTFAASVAADRNLPAVWLTPVLTSDWVVSALKRSTAPFLLIGGTADELWDSTLARKLTQYVLEVEGADHGMYVPGPLAGAAAVLGQVVTAVEQFLDDVVWR
jgi:hypothetical protein